MTKTPIAVLGIDLGKNSCSLAGMDATGAPRARVFAMLETLTEQPKLGVIAGAIVETMDEVDAIKLLELADTHHRSIIGDELASRLENAAVVRIPVASMTDNYELESKPLPASRKRAFELMRSGSPSAHHARLCLRAIDDLRDQHGRSLAEPNHPNLKIRMPWPEAAQLVWGSTNFECNAN